MDERGGRSAGGGNPGISVIIPYLNQEGYLATALAGLAAQEGAPPFEAVVVDNGSERLPEAIVAAHPFARLVAEAEPGPGPARNRGAAEARAPLLAFLDADCRPAPDWLAAVWARLGPGVPTPRADILGGEVRIPRAGARTTALEAFESVYSFRQELYVTRDGYAATCNMACPRAVFERVGPFGGIGIAEDRDWGRRAGRIGLLIAYAPEMRVWHPARPDFASIFAKIDRQMTHDFAETGRGAPARLRWAAKAVALGLSAPAEVPRILASDRIAGLSERLGAFGALARIRAYRAWRMLALLAGADRGTGATGWNRGAP